MQEIWKDIIIEKNGEVYDYTGLYQVSNYGRVKSLDRIDSNGHRLKGKIKKLRVNNMGYVCVGLSKDGKEKKFLVHRLVATAFIPNPKNLPVVNHLDENPSNNVWTNLEWCTQKHNAQYSSYKKKGKPRPEEVKKKLSKAHKGKKLTEEHKIKIIEAKRKEVICIETTQIFNSIKEAQEWCGIKNGICNCCQGKRSTAGGLHWMYLEDYKRQLRKQSDINNSKQLAA